MSMQWSAQENAQEPDEKCLEQVASTRRIIHPNWVKAKVQSIDVTFFENITKLIMDYF